MRATSEASSSRAEQFWGARDAWNSGVLRAFSSDFQRRSAVSCIVSVPDEDLELSREQATAFFRIFQEILTNVARHSKAGKICGGQVEIPGTPGKGTTVIVRIPIDENPGR
jgi:signal transduction histidine kinase